MEMSDERDLLDDERCRGVLEVLDRCLPRDS